MKSGRSGSPSPPTAISGAGRPSRAAEMVDNLIPSSRGGGEERAGADEIWAGSPGTGSRRRGSRSSARSASASPLGRSHATVFVSSSGSRTGRGIRAVGAAGSEAAEDEPAERPRPFSSTSRRRTGRRPGSTATRNGMAVTVGRLRPDALFDYGSCALHNTVRGAAGGAVLTAEMLTGDGQIQASSARRRGSSPGRRAESMTASIPAVPA